MTVQNGNGHTSVKDLDGFLELDTLEELQTTNPIATPLAAPTDAMPEQLPIDEPIKKEDTDTSQKKTKPIKTIVEKKHVISESIASLIGAIKVRVEASYSKDAKVVEPVKDTFTVLKEELLKLEDTEQTSGDKRISGFLKAWGYCIPFIAVALIGYGIGEYISKTVDLFTAYGTSFLVESSLAVVSILMGRSFNKIRSGKGNYAGAFIITATWLLLNTSSIVFLLLIFNNGNGIKFGSLENFGVLARVIAVTLADLTGALALTFVEKQTIEVRIANIHTKIKHMNEIDKARRDSVQTEKDAELRAELQEGSLKTQKKLGSAIVASVESVADNLVDDINSRGEEQKSNDTLLEYIMRQDKSYSVLASTISELHTHVQSVMGKLELMSQSNDELSSKIKKLEEESMLPSVTPSKNAKVSSLK